MGTLPLCDSIIGGRSSTWPVQSCLASGVMISGEFPITCSENLILGIDTLLAIGAKTKTLRTTRRRSRTLVIVKSEHRLLYPLCFEMIFHPICHAGLTPLIPRELDIYFRDAKSNNYSRFRKEGAQKITPPPVSLASRPIIAQLSDPKDASIPAGRVHLSSPGTSAIKIISYLTVVPGMT